MTPKIIAERGKGMYLVASETAAQNAWGIPLLSAYQGVRDLLSSAGMVGVSPERSVYSNLIERRLWLPHEGP